MQSERLKWSIKGLEVGGGGFEKKKRKAFHVVMSSTSAVSAANTAVNY